MTTTFALKGIPDRLTCQAASYLDIQSLLRLDCVSSKFHALTPTVEKDLPKIRALVRGTGWHDLGIKMGDKSKRRWQITPINEENWVLSAPEERKPMMLLFQKHSTEKPVPLKNEFFSDKSNKFLFTYTDTTLRVRDHQGALWCEIPSADRCSAYPLDSSNDKELIVLSLSDTIEIWDITKKMAPERLLAHSVASISGDAKIGDVIAILTQNQTGGVALWAFDHKNWRTAPKRIDHPTHKCFQEQEHYLSNSSQLFLRGKKKNTLIAFQAVNGSLHYSWEIRVSKDIRGLGEKWLLLPFKDASWDHQHKVDVIDTETGLLAPEKQFTDGTVNSSYYLWGNNILVALDFGAHFSFWHLPSWRKLSSYKIEGSDIHDVSCQQEALLFLHKNGKTKELRVQKLSLSTENPIQTSSLCDKICSAFSSFCRWIGSLWNWFWRSLA